MRSFQASAVPVGRSASCARHPSETMPFGATATLGSWDSYRAELDVTGPIAFDTALRGRATVTTSQRDYFYDSASAERTKVFAALAYDVTPNATLTFGGSYQRDETVPFLSGVPSYVDGSDPKLPRDTSLVFDWQQQPTRNTEAYAQYRPRLCRRLVAKGERRALALRSGARRRIVRWADRSGDS